MFVEILLGLLTLLVISYLYLRFWKWTYFGAKGLFQVEPSFPFGNFNDVFIWVTKLTIIAKTICGIHSGIKYFNGCSILID